MANLAGDPTLFGSRHLFIQGPSATLRIVLFHLIRLENIENIERKVKQTEGKRSRNSRFCKRPLSFIPGLPWCWTATLSPGKDLYAMQNNSHQALRATHIHNRR